MITNANRYDEPSWAETLQAYRKTTTSLPWKPEEQIPTKHVTTFEVSRKQRELDPVLMRFRDPSKELSVQTKEQNQTKQRITDARTRQLNYEQKFDIVTHVTHVPEAQLKPSYKTKAPDSRLTFNILNHQVLPGHPEPPKRNYAQERVVPTQVRKAYNILNNKYYENDEAKVSMEREKLKEDLDKKYWQSHDYHFIRGEFYDGKKEQDFLEMRNAAMQLHGKAKQNRLPASIVHSEGATYDIVSNLAKDEERLREAEEIANRAIRMKKGSQMEQMQKTTALMEEIREEERTLNRVRAERFTSEHQYNPLTNQTFEGRLGKSLPSHRAFVQDKAYEKVQNSQTNIHERARATAMLDVFNQPMAGTSPLPFKQAQLHSNQVNHERPVTEAKYPVQLASYGDQPSSFGGERNDGSVMQEARAAVPKLNFTNPNMKQKVRTGGFS